MGNNNILLGKDTSVEDAVGNACIIGNNSSGVGGSITIGRNVNAATYNYLVLGHVDGNGVSTLIPGPLDDDVQAANNNVPLGGIYYHTTGAGVHVLQIRLT